MPDYDVIVYGTVCLDHMWRVDRLAAAGTYEPIVEERKMIGGEAANTAMALVRWGLKVALVGTALGDDDDGRLLSRMFAEDAAALDVRHLPTQPDAQTAYCVCIATPDGHRTLYGRGFTTMQCPVLTPELARTARLFTMDPNAYQAGLHACEVAAQADIEIVAMDYTRSPEVNQAAAIAVTSHAQIDVPQTPAALAGYAAHNRDAYGPSTIVTCGENGCFVAEKGKQGQDAVHVPAYLLNDVVDSTGAGDIFRAGLIYGHLNGWDLLTTARFASAAAALNCTALGGWGGVRSVADIVDFQESTRLRPTGN